MKTFNWNISGKYVIITGATSGIGLAAAKALVAKEIIAVLEMDN